jgi:hypothetical protein
MMTLPKVVLKELPEITRHTVRRALGVGAHLLGCWTTIEYRSKERLATYRPAQ